MSFATICTNLQFGDHPPIFVCIPSLNVGCHINLCPQLGGIIQTHTHTHRHTHTHQVYSPVLLHEFDEVPAGRLGQESHARAEGVLLGAEAGVWGPFTLTSASWVTPVGDRLEVGCRNKNQGELIFFGQYAGARCNLVPKIHKKPHPPKKNNHKAAHFLIMFSRGRGTCLLPMI